MPPTSMIVYCPRSRLAGFTRFQNSRKWGKKSLLSETETAELMIINKRNEYKKKLDVHILKVYRKTADVKFWGKFTRRYGWRLGRLAQCIEVFQRSPQFSYFRLKKNVKKWGDEDSGAVIRRKTFERLSDIESDVNVRISELLEKIEI